MPDIYTDLADATDPAKGAGLVGLGVGVTYPSSTVGGVINNSGISQQVILSSIASVGSLSVPDEASELVLQSRTDGEGGFRAKEIANSGSLLAGQFLTNINTRRWENAEDTITPAMFANIEEMFAFTKAKIIMPQANYEFDSPITTRPGLSLSCEAGAVLRPTFEPIGGARATPLISFAAGATVDRLDVRLVAGIDTIRTLVQFNGGYQVGFLNLESVDLNNNRYAGDADLISGAVIFSGVHGRVGHIAINNFDRGWSVVDATDLVITHICNLGTVMGGFLTRSRHIHVLSGYTTGPADPSTPNSFNRGIMSKGANSILVQGCSDSSFSNWYTYDILEHAVRVGGRTDDVVFNERLTFNNLRMYRPYGCGFKCDDSDNFLIKDIEVNGLYTEDVGHGNWFGQEGFQNWGSPPGNSPENDNDGNKVGCAIRNSSRVRVRGFMNRRLNYDHSGYIGFWVERSTNVSASQIDTEHSRHAGVSVQSGGTQDCEKITLDNVTTRYNDGDGLRYNAGPSSSPIWRGVVTRGLISQNNVGAGYSVIAREDGSSPFATVDSGIEGRVSDNGGGNRLIPDVVNASSRFRDDVCENGIGSVTVTFATPGDLSVSYSSQSIIWQRDGNLVDVEIDLRATLTFTTSSGVLQVLGLPFTSISAANKIDLIASSAAIASWNSRVEMVPSVQNGTTRIELRGYAPGVGSAPITAADITSGVELLLRMGGRYRI